MSYRHGRRARAPGYRPLSPGPLLAVLVGLAAALAGYATLGHGEAPRGGAGARRALSAPPGRSTSVASVPAAVSIDARRPGPSVPPRFLGLSFEVASLRQIARFGGAGNLVALLRSLGPGVLRFGGVTADTRMAWTAPGQPPPPWASGSLSASDLRSVARLASESGWSVLLTIGLGHFDPAAAAAEAAAASAALGNSLAGIELGNEADAYGRHGLRETPWTYAQYVAESRTYRRAIAAAAPGIPLAGPDVSGSAVFRNWGRAEAAQLRPTLLTGHHYPLGCHQLPPPSIARLLSEETRLAEDVSLARYMRVARASGIRFRMDETNSVSCGGSAGVSDTFASALWAASYIARSMAAGVAGINFHGDPANCGGYAPLCASTPELLAAGELSARPEWYALLLTRALVGDRALPTALDSPGASAAHRPDLSVSSFLAPDGRVHVVVVDADPPGSAGVLLRVHAPSRYAEARVLTLTAPSPSAVSGVQLGGRSVALDGSWSEPSGLPSVPRRGDTITLAVAPSSAQLLTLR
jgi:hypothetical protein